MPVFLAKLLDRHENFFYIIAKQRSPGMNKTIISIILAAVVIISGTIAFFIIRNHRQLTE